MAIPSALENHVGMEQEFTFFVTDGNGMNRTEPKYSRGKSAVFELLDNTEPCEELTFDSPSKVLLL
jgi:hypothetical protein